MSGLLPTAQRVLLQVGRDRRTLAMLLLVPCLLLSLLAWLYDRSPQIFDRIGAPLLGLFPFVVMFLITSVTTLRERRSGTLERLLTMPISKGGFIGGYALAFGLLATMQAALAAALALGVLGLDVAGSVWVVVTVAVLDALLGTALGLLVSAFAATEFQAVQFMPAIVLPQVLLCGLLVPRQQMTDVLRWVSDILPLSYAVDAMRHVTVSTAVDGALLTDIGVIGCCIGLALALGSATLRRRST